MRWFVMGLGVVALAPVLAACPAANEDGPAAAPLSAAPDAGRGRTESTDPPGDTDQPDDAGAPVDGGSPVTATVTGTVGGRAFAAVSSASLVVTYAARTPDNANPFPVTVATLVFSSDANGFSFCPSPKQKAGGVHMSVQIGAQGEAITKGTYVVQGGKIGVGKAVATFLGYDEACRATSDDDATGGTVTVTTVDAGGIGGTVEVTFPSGSVKGTFSIPVCARRSRSSTG